MCSREDVTDNRRTAQTEEGRSAVAAANVGRGSRDDCRELLFGEGAVEDTLDG